MPLLDEEEDDEDVHAPEPQSCDHTSIRTLTSLADLTRNRKELVTGSQRLCIGPPLGLFFPLVSTSVNERELSVAASTDTPLRW